MKWIILLLTLILAYLTTGCAYSHHGDYEWGFRICTGYEIVQHAPETDTATAETDIRPLVDAIIELRPDDD